MPDDPEIYANLRHKDLAGRCIGHKLVEITQNEPNEPCAVYLHFDDGTTVTLVLGCCNCVRISIETI